MQEWFTAKELADFNLPGLPATKRAINEKAKNNGWTAPEKERSFDNPTGTWRKRSGRGGGVEFHKANLPARAKAVLATKLVETTPEQTPLETAKRSAIWESYEAAPEKKKEQAKKRLKVLQAVDAMIRAGEQKEIAVRLVAAQPGMPSERTIYYWFDLVTGQERDDWLPHLMPRHAGRTATTAECTPQAWEFIKGDWLRLEQPKFSVSYRRLKMAADEHGWTIPSCKTLKRKMDDEVSKPVQVLARKGMDALKRMYPAQERDRSCFHALEAVNADGHKFDVFAKWPDGEIGRPLMVAIQDLYSGKLLAWRIDKSENKEAVRLTIGDVVENYGIPDRIYLDNGRAFASKWLTGGVKNRYRFKITDEDPVGILPQLGVTVHWTTPYAGQSKPIERMFLDFCDNISTHPAFAGAYTGNRPDAKPENYGKTAVPIEKFIKIVEQGIIEHNAREGRRTKICEARKLSFDQAFQESYENSQIKIATDEQCRLWLLAAEKVQSSKRDGAINFMKNRYWATFLQGHNTLGHKLSVRFDPQKLHDGLHVYRLDGSYLGFAECIHAVGFADQDAAQEHGRARRQFQKATRERLDALRTLAPDQVADLLPETGDTPAPETKVVRAVFSGAPGARPTLETRKDPEPVPLTEAEELGHTAVIADLETFKSETRDPAQLRFERARNLERALKRKEEIPPQELLWLKGYRDTAEYRARKGMEEDFGPASSAG